VAAAWLFAGVPAGHCMKLASILMTLTLGALGLVAAAPTASAICVGPGTLCAEVNNDHCVVDTWGNVGGTHTKVVCSYNPFPTVCLVVINDASSFTCIVGVGSNDSSGCLLRVAVFGGPNGEGFTHFGCP
jgi:hypothetical protein